VIAYLPQHLLTQDNVTVFEEASKAFHEVHQMQTELDELNEQLTIRTDYESDDYMKLIERVSELSEKFYSVEETNYDAEVERRTSFDKTRRKCEADTKLVRSR